MAGTITYPDLSMAWNGHGVTRYQFSQTMDIKQGDNIQHALNWTAVVARQSEKGYLECLVINCHGLYNVTDPDFGHLTGAGLGLWIGTGLTTTTGAGRFKALAGLVRRIHIDSCGAAAVNPGAVCSPRKCWANGELFCQTVANASGAIVVASADLQPDSKPEYPHNTVNKLQGRVSFFHPQSDLSSSIPAPKHGVPNR